MNELVKMKVLFKQNLLERSQLRTPGLFHKMQKAVLAFKHHFCGIKYYALRVPIKAFKSQFWEYKINWTSLIVVFSLTQLYHFSLD